MAVVKFPQSNFSLATRGIVGRPIGAGAQLAGYSWVADQNPFSGIYQSRPSKAGRVLVKMKHYRSPNPQTDKQQAWRGYFRDVLIVWHAMSIENKHTFTSKRRSGAGGWWNKFARAYMSRKPSDAGIMRAGMCECGGLTIV